MAQRHQRGWLKKEKRKDGDTWMLFLRTTRQSDGKRVEQKIAIGTVCDFPSKAKAWAEVERQHIQINKPDFRKRVTFADLAYHYEQHELGERKSAVVDRKPTLPLRVISGYCATACSPAGARALRSASSRLKLKSGFPQ